MKTQCPSLPVLIQRFFCDYLASQRNASPCTIASYRDAMRLLLQFLSNKLNRPIDRIHLEDFHSDNLQAFLEHGETVRNNGPRTRNQRLAAIRTFLRYAGWNLPEAMPIVHRALAIPRKSYERPLVDFLTRDEMDAVLQAPSADRWSGQRDRALFAAMYNTGARVSEIVQVRVDDVVLGRSASIRLHGKGRKERRIPLWQKTATHLRDWIDHNSFASDAIVFPNRHGEEMTRSGVEKRLRRAVQSANETCDSLHRKTVSPHVLRHTTAMHLFQSGVDLTVIALWLGHESVETTHLYMTADLKMKEEALSRIQEPQGKRIRYKPTDKLLAFLESL